MLVSYHVRVIDGSNSFQYRFNCNAICLKTYCTVLKNINYTSLMFFQIYMHLYVINDLGMVLKMTCVCTYIECVYVYSCLLKKNSYLQNSEYFLLTFSPQFGVRIYQLIFNMVILHDENYYESRKPRPNLGPFRNFLRLVWDNERKAFLDRTAIEWGNVNNDMCE